MDNYERELISTIVSYSAEHFLTKLDNSIEAESL